MSKQNFGTQTGVLRTAVAALLAVALGSGCSPSTDSAAQKHGLDDVRGAPIKPAVAATSTEQPAAPAAAQPQSALPDSKNPPPQTNAVAAPATGAAPGADEVRDGDFLVVGFDKLASFNFEVPDEPTTNQVATAKSENQIPPTVKALDQKAVAIKGFMLPLKVESGLVTEMLIMRDQSMCCYGTVPKINEWVSVKMVERGVKAVMDQPVTIYGKLRVGEMRENGYLVGIYQMDGQKMEGPADL